LALNKEPATCCFAIKIAQLFAVKMVFAVKLVKLAKTSENKKLKQNLF